METSVMYVDVENLQEIAKQAVLSALANWPPDFPKPDTVKFYVRADQTALWEIWATHNVPDVEVRCKGVQHYTFMGSKNSADLSLALDALADVLKGRTKHVAVLSDDSDFVSLFSALKQETSRVEDSRMSFKWIMTDRQGTRSQMMIDFFPTEHIHVVACSAAEGESERADAGIVTAEALPEAEVIAMEIIRDLPVGSFKSTDCRKIIKQSFPMHSLNKADSASFGTHFTKMIWPFLEKYGVKTQKVSKRPRKYEITEEAKHRLPA